MDKYYESKYHCLEDSHWWFQGRRDFILKLLSSQKKDSKILDIGCSGGSLLVDLQNNGFENIFGTDISKDSISLCKTKGIQNVVAANATQLDFSSNQFDVLIASDVLEHIKQDTEALKEWHRILKPNGRLFVFVPAFQYLWSGHDELNQHFRRYTDSMLVSRLKECGFQIIRSSYWNLLLFFPTFILRIAQKLLCKTSHPKDQLLPLPPLLNQTLIFLLRLENTLLRWIKFPVGVSVFAIAKK